MLIVLIFVKESDDILVSDSSQTLSLIENNNTFNLEYMLSISSVVSTCSNGNIVEISELNC